MVTSVVTPMVAPIGALMVTPMVTPMVAPIEVVMVTPMATPMVPHCRPHDPKAAPTAVPMTPKVPP